VEAHSGLAFIYAQQGHLDEAIQHNQLVLQQLPNDYDSLKNLAILYQQKERFPEAVEVAQQAQQAAPDAEKATWDKFISDLQSQLATGS
jgi:tetratricopeptide (TPR) repeat protein